MNAFKLTDFHGNFYMIESTVSDDLFAEILYDFCVDNYSFYSNNECDDEMQVKALEELVNTLKLKGFSSRLIKPSFEHHMWVWE